MSIEPDRLAYDTFAAMIGGTAELKYVAGMAEIDQTELSTAYVVAEGLELSAVGAGLGGGFLNTAELKVMNYKEAMRSPEKEQWIEEISNEKRRFDKFGAVTPVPRSSVSPIFYALLQLQYNHSKAAVHHCHPQRFTQLHQQLQSKACLKGSCHQRRRVGGTCQCQTCLVKTLR